MTGTSRAVMFYATLCLSAIMAGNSVAQTQLADPAGSRSEAAELAKALHGPDARIIGVRERTDADGRQWFEVKLLSNGKVLVYRVDG